MKKILYPVSILLLILGILFALFLAYSSIREYNPATEISLLDFRRPDTLRVDSSYSVMIWNIGYGGLGENMDFFYDGGNKVRDSRDNVERNIEAIISYIHRSDTIDFILLQEVDFASKRSYYIKQNERIDWVLPDHFKFSGINYKVDFIPVPPKAPLGKVESGIITCTRYYPESVYRRGFSGNYTWPTRLFMLKRCFLVSRFPTNNENEFVLVNLHNSAYDDGSLRAEQLQVLESFALQEYQKGNYIILGGDWNQSPDGFNPKFDQPFDTINVSYLPEGFLKGWIRNYIDSVPSNRRIKTPYIKGKTAVTVIDFFISSPNVKLSGTHCSDLRFENSDHQPIKATIRLN